MRRRQLLANLVSVSLTGSLLLAISALALWSVESSSAQRERPRPTKPSQAATLPADPTVWPRLIGVTADPWHSDEWARATRHVPDIVMIFRNWHRRTPLEPMLAEARRRGLTFMLTWEPWKPVHSTAKRNGWLQPRYSNEAIAAGRLDPYIRSVAREIARHRQTVLIRYAHEMTGEWYPWHHNPEAYKQAWRHIWEVFRQEGATNVVWIWSVNSNIREPRWLWWSKITAYYPGARYVDIIGATTVRSARKQFTVAQFGRRLEALREFGKPVWMTEIAASEAREQFLIDLRAFVRDNPWVRGVVWSQVKTIPEPHWRSAKLLAQVFAEVKRPQAWRSDASERSNARARSSGAYSWQR